MYTIFSMRAENSLLPQICGCSPNRQQGDKILHSTLHYTVMSPLHYHVTLPTSLEPFPSSKSPFFPSFTSLPLTLPRFLPPSLPPSLCLASLYPELLSYSEHSFQSVLRHVFNAYCHHAGEDKLALSDPLSLISDADDCYLTTKCANNDEKLLRHEDFFLLLADFKLNSRIK